MAVKGLRIYTSTDSGGTWNVQNSAPTAQWYSVTSSADGTKLVAVGGSVYTSVDSGVTWTASPSAPIKTWYSVVSSADGTKIVTGDYSPGNIYSYKPLVRDLKVNILIPSNDEIVSAWTPFVSLGSASTCAYSWDNVNWVNASCASNGSDIPVPDSNGEKTLYVK